MKSHISAVRATMNNARKGKNGVFLPIHNDGEEGKAAQMNGILCKWNYTGNKDKPFDNVEADFYEENCKAGLDAQNERHRKKGNKKRVKEMDEYRKAEETCPESTLFYLGDKDNYVDPRRLLQVVTEFLNWREKRFPSVVSLDFAMHIEDGAPHIHERHVWIGHDEYGNKIVSQGKALEEMGVQPPDLDKARKAAEYREQAKEASTKDERKELISKAKGIERHNNAKMTYTRECREKLFEIAREHGIEIITKPREKGKQGQTQDKFITDDNNEKIAKQNEELSLGEKALIDQRNDYDKLTKEIAEKKAELDRLKQEMGDTLEYKAFCAKRKTERAAKRAQEEKAIQPVSAEKIVSRQNPQIAAEEENVRESAQNTPETPKSIEVIPDTPKAQIPLKNDRRSSEAYAKLKKANSELITTEEAVALLLEP